MTLTLAQQLHDFLLTVAAQASEREGVLSNASLDAMDQPFFEHLGIDKSEVILLAEQEKVVLRNLYWEFRRTFERESDYEKLNHMHSNIDWMWTCLKVGQFMSYAHYQANYSSSSAMIIPNSQRWTADIHMSTEGNTWLIIAGLYLTGNSRKAEDLSAIIGPPFTEWDIEAGLEELKSTWENRYKDIERRAEFHQARAAHTGSYQERALAERGRRRKKNLILMEKAVYLQIAESLAPNSPKRTEFITAVSLDPRAAAQQLRYHIHKANVAEVYRWFIGVVVDIRKRENVDHSNPRATYRRLPEYIKVVWNFEQFDRYNTMSRIWLNDSRILPDLKHTERAILTRYGIAIND